MKKILMIIALFFALFGLSSCIEPLGDDIINPDADFVYYYGKTCPHCINLHTELIKKDLYNRTGLEKKEVWNNPENQKEFAALTDSLGLGPEDVGVPFLYVKSTKKHYVGAGNIVPILEAGAEKIAAD